MTPQFSEGDYWNNSYRQENFITFGGETCLAIIPNICPIGKYSCAKRIFSTNEDDIHLSECSHVIHYSDKAVYCQQMRHGASQMERETESFEDLF